ncbi:MAG: A/G-specific adenine glycosylase [Motiliproteus sp.]|nr:A/G-specific adenine glycosylase [Motiliproteus sp.]MCW9053608.1 A/G-specific adenine glycosylase [Motiliproteus sp.]
MLSPEVFQQAVLTWFDQHGRKDLPWQHHINPYRVWVSEIMLQQTQVATVIPYYQRFMDAFPDVESLAAADIDQVLHLWTGLGYYARGRNLHKTAIQVVQEQGGEFPLTVSEMEQLPGIGRSTAGAILAIASGVRAPILDGNVKRVLARFEAQPGWYGQSAVLKKLWAYSERYTPNNRVGDYTQAMMDLGATLCTRSRPRCGECPLVENCSAYATDTVDRFPEPRPKKQIPLKQCWMLLLEDGNGQVQLHRRPPAGIWGGLWCFPEYPSHEALLTEAEGLGYQPDNSPSIDSFTHTFSHYQLRVHPVRMRVGEQCQQVAEAKDQLWCDLHQPAEVGLAAPVKKLLKQLAKDHKLTMVEG